MLTILKKLGNNKFLILLSIILVLTLCSIFLNIKNVSSPNEIFADGENYFDLSENTDFVSYSDYIGASNLQSMYNQSEYIVVGRYGDFVTSYNMSRNPDNPKEEEAKDDYLEGHVYNFHIESVIKGKIDADTIEITIPYLERVCGEIRNDIIDKRGEIVKPATEIDLYEINAIYKFYMQPVPEDLVILFLRHSSLFDYYCAAVEPYMIVLENGETARLKSNLLLPYETRGKMSITESKSKSGRVVTWKYNDLLDSLLTDTISGKSLNELLAEINSFKKADGYADNILDDIDIVDEEYDSGADSDNEEQNEDVDIDGEEHNDITEVSDEG